MPKLAPRPVREALISKWAKATPIADLHSWAMATVSRIDGERVIILASKLRNI